MNGVNLANRNLSGSVGISPIGGTLRRFVWGGAAASVKGLAVSVDPSADRQVVETALTTTGCIGVLYEDGILPGADIWVVTDGPAEVAFNDNVGVPGNYVRIPVAGDAAIAVQEVIELQWTHAGVSVAGTVMVKIPGLAAVPVVTAGGDNAAAMAALVQAEAASFPGWTLGTIGDTTTFTQNVGATTDGVMSVTYGTTATTATIAATATGKPAITPAAGVAVADSALPADGTEIGILLQNHTARLYADGVFTAQVLLKGN